MLSTQLHGTRTNKSAVNSINRIKSIINETKADVILINEANLNINHEVVLIKINGFNVEYDKMYTNKNNARSIMYIKEDIVYKRIKKYENEEDSAICIQIGIPKTNKFYIYGIYRQWSIPGVKESKKIVNQEYRWKNTLKMMSKVLSEGKETIIIGDINLNTLAFFKDYNEKTKYEKSLSKMYDDTVDLIKNYNLVNHNIKYTTRKESILDVILSNKPEKVLSIKVHENTEGSDHKPVILKRTFKNNIENQNYIYFRDYKNYDMYEVQHNMIIDSNHVEILKSDNPSEASEMLVKMINDSLSGSAPMKKIVIKKEKIEKINLSKATLEKINTFEIQKSIVKATNDKVEIKILKNLRKEVIIMKDKDRFCEKAKYLRNQKSEIGLWNTFKKNYKEKKYKPILLKYNNKIAKGPKDMANMFNEAFINKINKLKENIPSGEDPMINYVKMSKNVIKIFCSKLYLLVM